MSKPEDSTHIGSSSAAAIGMGCPYVGNGPSGTLGVNYTVDVMANGGGSIVGSPAIVIDFWGQYYNSPASLAERNAFTSQATALMNSRSYWDLLYEYNVTPGQFHGVVQNQPTIGSADNTSTTIVTTLDDADIRALLISDLAADPALAALNPVVIVIVMGPGIDAGVGGGSGAHRSLISLGLPVEWAKLGYQPNTLVLAHEVAESATDPDVDIVGTGFDDKQFGNEGEVADLCNGVANHIAGQFSQKMWSQRLCRCIGRPILDFNRDEHSDIALTGGKQPDGSAWTTIPVAFWTGPGAFTATNGGMTGDAFPLFATEAGARPIPGDFDGDGRLDIALLGGLGRTTVPLALSNGDGTFRVTDLPGGPFADTLAHTPGATPVPGDFNGDGFGDIALVGGVGWDFVVVALSNGDGSFQVTNVPMGDFASSWAQGANPVSGDFDGDGFADIALTGGVQGNAGFIPVAYSNGDGTFRIASALVGNFAINQVQAPGAWSVAGDFDGDGLSDIALVGGAGPDTIPVAFSNGVGAFSVVNTTVIGPPFLSFAALPGARPVQGDFDGDGLTDIAIVGDAPGTTNIHIALGGGRTAFVNSGDAVVSGAPFATFAAAPGAIPLGDGTVESSSNFRPSCSPVCTQGGRCGANFDCGSGVCTGDMCQPPACFPTCLDGVGCGANGDCGSRACVAGRCQAPGCAPHCNQGTGCGANGDCSSGVCAGGQCRPPACSPSCGLGNACGLNADCLSLVCTNAKCQSPSCAPRCNQGAACGVNGDCSSGVCRGGHCQPPACSPSCGLGNACGVNADCLSLVCTNAKCQSPSCAPNCVTGAACGVNADCKSRVCTAGKCR